MENKMDTEINSDSLERTRLIEYKTNMFYRYLYLKGTAGNSNRNRVKLHEYCCLKEPIKAYTLSQKKA